VSIVAFSRFCDLGLFLLGLAAMMLVGDLTPEVGSISLMSDSKSVLLVMRLSSELGLAAKFVDDSLRKRTRRLLCLI
jgi:hypothetical protein